jgi:hypothetical protein
MRQSSAPSMRAFDFPFRVEAKTSEFRPLDTLRHVDVDKLKKGTHRVEIGFSEAGCCRKLVRAVVKNGMVTGIEVEPCKESKQASSKQVRALAARVSKALGRNPRAKWKAVPVHQFFSSPANVARLTISWGGWCVQGCWTVGNVMHCLYCCAWPPSCRIDSIFVGTL